MAHKGRYWPAAFCRDLTPAADPGFWYPLGNSYFSQGIFYVDLVYATTSPVGFDSEPATWDYSDGRFVLTWQWSDASGDWSLTITSRPANDGVVWFNSEWSISLDGLVLNTFDFAFTPWLQSDVISSDEAYVDPLTGDFIAYLYVQAAATGWCGVEWFYC